MSHNYELVLWNRQKKIYDRIMGGLMLLYLLCFAVLQILFYPQITAETLIIRATGSLAFLMLHLILCIGPLSRLQPRFLPILYNRRHLGVSMFLVALVHGVFNTIQFHALGNRDPILSLFTSNLHYDSFANFPFQTLGFIALLILFLMAATSHDFWLKNLSPRIWKGLHMMVYLAYALLVLHVLLGIGQLETASLRLGIVGAGVLLVTGLHLSAALIGNRRERAIKPEPERDFVRVCPVEDISDQCATTVMIGEENIALFRYDGQVSAVSNLCRHQNGPLGEGKIVNGCITCPWHGYQYLPHNGQSPPPFEEKLETYDVQIREGIVYVNPKAYAPGTERPPAKI
ncbi:MAG: Rieske 2Fe-2S domain-containing protein [Bacteroidota bacterium]